MSEDYADLPHDLEAERSVLGAAMLSPESAGLVVDTLTIRHFYRAAHQVVFECVTSLVERSAPVDIVTVRAELERRSTQEREQVHPRLLFDLIESVTAAGHIEYHLRLLQEQYFRRKLFMAGRRLKALGSRSDLDIEDVAEQSRKILDQVAEVPEGSSAKPVSELIGPYLDRLESKAPEVGVTTGWVDLDSLVTRLRPGQLIVVGARPGMGKSVLMVNMALHVGVRLKLPVFFASLEMSHDEILARMVAHEAGVTLQKLQQRDLNADDWTRVAKKQAELDEADHLIVDDDPGISIGHLRAKLSTMRRSGHPAAIVFIDYLQLMSSAKRSENRQQEVSDLSRNLKLLAKDMGVPVVVGAQLNRGPELRANKRPMKSDLRESGSLEQDADIVILLHREDAYEAESPRAGEVDLIVDKHRQGATATITAAFQGHYSRIADMAPEPSHQWSPTAGMR
ncbi:replicative DNA helicase [Sphaerisporangium sp. TRM90804]|uniref:replicative DNA helicase n=1 Tax=Sphaerisporangium sp. TRM90804 TaxID=3031113 RepID=UPI00244B890F|nr:replicative DNA helicase [Sphaerisporangium sp. TRM90804]MDH2424810.1 replicative DNA helicase [Sphaerisporangium sp. TRM90804]